MDHKYLITSLVMILMLLGGCTESTEKQNDVLLYTNSVDIDYGSDMCSFTNEVIETVRYGGKIDLENGESHKFMSVECVAGFYLSMDETERDKIVSIDIVDFAHGQQYLPVEELVFLKSSLRPSPNGMNLTAIDNSNERMKTYIYDAYPGDFMSWDEVLELVNEEWNLNGSVAQKR